MDLYNESKISVIKKKAENENVFEMSFLMYSTVID